jgi:hypothetical protein
MKYVVCEECGANLDHGEKCSCHADENRLISRYQKHIEDADWRLVKCGDVKRLSQLYTFANHLVR